MADSSWTWDDSLRGVIPPMISPLTESGVVDVDAVGRMADYILDGGCSGLFVLGGTGEGAWLSTSQREAIVSSSVRATAGRAPVLVGLMLPGTAPARDAALQAADIPKSPKELKYPPLKYDPPKAADYRHKLATAPDFEYAYIDGYIRFVKAPGDGPDDSVDPTVRLSRPSLKPISAVRMSWRAGSPACSSIRCWPASRRSSRRSRSPPSSQPTTYRHWWHGLEPTRRLRRADASRNLLAFTRGSS